MKLKEYLDKKYYGNRTFPKLAGDKKAVKKRERQIKKGKKEFQRAFKVIKTEII